MNVEGSKKDGREIGRGREKRGEREEVNECGKLCREEGGNKGRRDGGMREGRRDGGMREGTRG